MKIGSLLGWLPCVHKYIYINQSLYIYTFIYVYIHIYMRCRVGFKECTHKKQRSVRSGIEIIKSIS